MPLDSHQHLTRSSTRSLPQLLLDSLAQYNSNIQEEDDELWLAMLGWREGISLLAAALIASGICASCAVRFSVND